AVMDMAIKNLKRAGIPVLMVVGFSLVVYLISANPPKTERKHRPEVAQLVVDVQNLQLRSYQMKVQSYGTVKPRTSGDLISQVAGKVEYISENFRVGGFFEKDELLLKIDSSDYEADLQSAKAALVSTQQGLVEEEARAKVASQEWNRLGNKSIASASALALRKPQLRARKAMVDSAEAALQKSQLNYNKTSIRAPYAGRVLSKNVAIGQVVTTNKIVASIYAVDYFEIRLPIKNQDLQFIELPENYRKQTQTTRRHNPKVTIYSNLIGQRQWQAQLVRTEGAIDTASQQLHVIAQIADPYAAPSRDKPPLKIGQYVTAIIQGKNLHKVLVIPNKSIYNGSYVYVVVDDLLQRREVVLAWQNQRDAIISDGLAAGDRLVITPLGKLTSGTRVKVNTEKSKSDLINDDASVEKVPAKQGKTS
ncbi:MAG: efflux RND transporter periplasmic adaptor subunit, partial [Thiohalomonadales bacterium]